MKATLYICFFAVLFVVGCQPIINTNSTPVVETQLSNIDVTETQVIPTTEPSPTITPELFFNKISTADNSETRLNNQCLNITDAPPTSNSIIIFRSWKTVERQSPDLIFFDMSEEQPRETIKKTRFAPSFAVSVDKKLIAYLASTINDGEVTQLDLIIANGNFETQNSIPWDDNWFFILGWTTDQKVIISSSITETSSPSTFSYVLVDPKNGGQQAIHLSIPEFLDKSLYDLPYWDGWQGLLIDPTLNLAVHPRQSNVNKEMLTYALWDISNNKTLYSLENIISTFSYFSGASPKPSWATEGTQFAFVGTKQESENPTHELFSVNRAGDFKQLTNLTGIGYVWPSFHSWSPDNSHIAFFLSPPQAGGLDDANVAIVNTNTFEVTDLCLSVNFQDFAPMWSPNGKQFLIIDQQEKKLQKILLVDIEKNIVFPIAEGFEPIGWMVKP